MIRVLKTQVDNAEIHYATKARFSGIAARKPLCGQAPPVGRQPLGLIATLRKEKFDYIIDLHHNLRTRLIKLSLG